MRNPLISPRIFQHFKDLTSAAATYEWLHITVTEHHKLNRKTLEDMYIKFCGGNHENSQYMENVIMYTIQSSAPKASTFSKEDNIFVIDSVI